MNARYVSVLLGAVVAAWLQPASAESTQCTPIAAVPFYISTPGSYCLTNDVSFNTALGVAITIGADNVSLDLNGHSIVDNGDASAGILAVGRRNVRIRNGEVRGFAVGVVLDDQQCTPFTYCGLSGEYRVEDMTITQCATGVFLNGANLLVRRNSIYRAQRAGISVQGAGPSLVADNAVMNVNSTEPGYPASGIYSTSPGTVERNTVGAVTGPSGSSGIRLGGGGIAVDNREINTPTGVLCDSTLPVEKVRDNIASVSSGTAIGMNYCSPLGTNG